MIDSFPDKLIGGDHADPESEQQKPPIETGMCVMADPTHPEYSADKAIALVLNGGESGVIAAIDGVGSGGEDSILAAEIIQRQLLSINSQIINTPTVKHATSLLSSLISEATAQIKALQRERKNYFIDTTASIGIVCQDDSGVRVLVTANVGDSRVYRYQPSKGRLGIQQLTIDHTLVQAWVNDGSLEPQKAFSHPQRNIILKAIGTLDSPDSIDYSTTIIEKGDVFFSVSDGVTDNLPPGLLAKHVHEIFNEVYNPNTDRVDLSQFSQQLASRAREVQVNPNVFYAKKDDICVAVLHIAQPY